MSMHPTDPYRKLVATTTGTISAFLGSPSRTAHIILSRKYGAELAAEALVDRMISDRLLFIGSCLEDNTHLHKYTFSLLVDLAKYPKGRELLSSLAAELQKQKASFTLARGLPSSAFTLDKSHKGSCFQHYKVGSLTARRVELCPTETVWTTFESGGKWYLEKIPNWRVVAHELAHLLRFLQGTSCDTTKTSVQWTSKEEERTILDWENPCAMERGGKRRITHRAHCGDLNTDQLLRAAITHGADGTTGEIEFAVWDALRTKAPLPLDPSTISTDDLYALQRSLIPSTTEDEVFRRTHCPHEPFHFDQLLRQRVLADQNYISILVHLKPKPKPEPKKEASSKCVVS